MPAYYLAISSLCDDYVKNILKNNVQSVIIESSRDIFVGVVMANSNTKKWWKNAIIYQIYPGSFCDSNGDGIGDISGIISKLHYLKEFGVDAIWLGPVFASPNAVDGYDVSDYKSINPDFGTMEDMEKLISRAKRLGMKIIMDLVINNTSDEHIWFRKALEGDPKYREYYYFRPGKGRKAPNNWDSLNGGKAWSKTANGDYYLHLYGEKQPDLNWSNPDVFNEIADVMRFWLDKGIAGFRCDAINILYKNNLDDGKLHLSCIGKEHYLNSEGCHDLLNRLNQEVWSKYKSFIVGDTVFVTPEDAKLLSDENRKEMDAILSFEHKSEENKVAWGINKFCQPSKFIRTLDKWQEALEVPANYMENYDYKSIVKSNGRYSEKTAKLLCGINLSLKGVAFINAIAETKDKNDILSFYKRMIEFRKGSQALAEGTYRRVASPSDVYVFTRESIDERLYVYCNLTPFNRSVEFYGDRIVLANYEEEERENRYLKPYEFRIVASNI